MHKDAMINALSALAQPTRYDVFQLLVQSAPVPIAAGDLATRLAIPQNTLSSHLSILQQAGLINQQKDGRKRMYALNADQINQFLRVLTQDCCAGTPEDCGF